MFYAVFTTFLVLVTIPFIVSVHASVSEGKWLMLVFHSLLYILALLTVLVKKIPFKAAAIVGLICIFIAGAVALFIFGPIGSGKTWLFSFSIMATILFGMRTGLFTVILNALILVLIAFLIKSSSLEWASNPLITLKMWIITGFTFSFLNGVIVVSLAVLVDALENKIIKEKQLREDISRSSEELAESEEKLSQAIQGSVVPTFVIDINHTITHWNDACSKVTGKSPEDMVGTKNQWIAFGTKNKPVPADLVLQKEQGVIPDSESFDSLRPSPLVEDGLEGDLIVKTPTGDSKLLLCTAAVLRNRSGEAVGAIQTFMDITERKRVEAQLQQASKMDAIGRLAGGVAHDFNNMLSVIIGHTELILSTIEDDSSYNNNLEEIMKAAQRSADLTRQLLGFARKQNVIPELLNLNSSIHQIFSMLERLIGEDIELTLTQEENLWPILMDKTQLDQIFANLCVNARDAINGVGRINIATSNIIINEESNWNIPFPTAGKYVLLSVSDNGPGMDPETLKQIFEPFFTTKETGKGTGLGLATIHGIVKQNNGYINVYSEPGHGTTFRIYIPTSQKDVPTMTNTSQNTVSTGNHERILLVEDEQSIRKMTKNMLETLGYKVIEVDNPEEAIAIVINSPTAFDLLVTDVVMPGMNGKDLADHLVRLSANLKVLFMSGYTSDIIASRGVINRDVYFLSKPFSKSQLAEKVQQALNS